MPGRRRPGAARDQAYLAVLVDDLITQGVTEPYPHVHQPGRVRRTLAKANADARLTEVGRAGAWSTMRVGRPSAASAMLFHVKQNVKSPR